MGGSQAEKKRVQALKLLDDHIGQQLRQSESSGELKAAPSYGKPLDFGDGYDETPTELRMGMKVLKDAGVVPPEVELMQQAAALEVQLAACQDDATRRELQRQLADKRQAIALRLERLRLTGSL
jgi:DNA-binding transcriptional ArsR family regulator